MDQIALSAERVAEGRERILGELRKVIWPTRSMLVTYTVVCLVFVTFMVIVVTSLDYGFTKLVFALFG
jgi:preprotein translocase subunit SecE